MKLMREQLETEAATRLARDNQREEEFKREKAAHQASLAQEAALKQRAEDLAAAEKAGKLKAEADAAKKADEAEKKAKKDKEKYEKDAEEWKKSEATLKAAKEEAKKEADALRPSPDDALAPVKFTDARGRSWMFPWRYCKQWKVSPQVYKNHVHAKY
jgi:membrane protein involved in colicin uptake